MPNVIYVNGTFSVQTAEGTTPLGLSTQVTTTGSNMVQIFTNVAMSSWQPLVTSSLSDLRYAAFVNYGDPAEGTIKVSTDSSGTNVISILAPGDSSVVSWSGSIAASPLYCQAFNNSGSLAYQLTES